MELLTIKEVCKMLKISRWTVTKLVENGELKAHMVSKNYRFKRDDVDNMINQSVVSVK